MAGKGIPAPRSRSIRKSHKEFLLEELLLELKLVRSVGQKEGDKPSAKIPAVPGAPGPVPGEAVYSCPGGTCSGQADPPGDT